MDLLEKVFWGGLRKMVSNLKHQGMVKCKYCDSVNVVKFGTYKGVQRWWCKDCKRKFIDEDTIYKMKTPIERIASALDCYYGGMSLDNIGRHLEQQYGTRLTDAGVYNWLVRFTDNAVREANKVKPNVGNVWVADETVLKIGGQNIWLWNIMDARTRFLLNTHLSTTRTTKDAFALMKGAEARAGKVPEIVITDKLKAYLDGIELAYGGDTTHIPHKGFTAPMNTNLIERLHGTLKDRVKTMRGFRDIESAHKLIDGLAVHYNYFREHETLGKTPAQKAGVTFAYKNWADVVRGSKDDAIPSERKTDGNDIPHITFKTIRASPKRKREARGKRKRRDTMLAISLKGVR